MAVGLVILVGLCLFEAGELVSEDNEMLLYLGALIFAALYLGRGPTRAATFTSLLILNLGRIHPAFRIGFQKFQYVISFGVFLVVSDQIARLADSVRHEAWRARELYLFTQECAHASQPESVAQLLQQHATWHCGIQLQVVFSPAPGPPLKTPRGVYAWLSAPVKANLLLENLMAQAALALERIDQGELQRQASVLEATQKLQSALINSISHDLQTPLSSIRGSVETLQAWPLQSPERGELFEVALDQIDRLQKLVKNILNSSKMQTGALELNRRNISLEEVVQGVKEGFSPALQNRLHCRVVEPVPKLRADFALLSQLVYNLVDNALKYSSGPVRIELQGRSARVAQLSVQDQGCGIQTEDLPHIFERFYRGKTPQRRPGSGLGLNICKAVAELHQAQLQVQSCPGEGSLFTLSLPTEDGGTLG